MTHEERLALINKPFPQVTRHQISYPWAGTIVNQNPFYDGSVRRFLKDDNNPSWDNITNTIEGSYELDLDDIFDTDPFAGADE